MNYVKLFSINGVDTKQVACIELQGAPNAATEGAVGVLGMDVTSPTHEVYRCVAVEGSVYKWELLSAGMSIISATITGQGGESKTFPYDKLRIPKNYLIKPGDLILDKEGYLYQIASLGADGCNSTYCGTHIGGMASGDKDYALVVKDGQLKLVTESGVVLGKADYMTADDNTITRDANGVGTVRGLKTIRGTTLRLFVGTRAEYMALSDEQKYGLFAIITDDTALDDVNGRIAGLVQSLEEGGVVVRDAKYLVTPDSLDLIYITDLDAGHWIPISPNQILIATIANVGSTTVLYTGYTSYSGLMVDAHGTMCRIMVDYRSDTTAMVYFQKYESGTWNNKPGGIQYRIIEEVV